VCVCARACVCVCASACACVGVGGGRCICVSTCVNVHVLIAPHCLESNIRSSVDTSESMLESCSLCAQEHQVGN
jgi:hypothetical protein